MTRTLTLLFWWFLTDKFTRSFCTKCSWLINNISPVSLEAVCTLLHTALITCRTSRFFKCQINRYFFRPFEIFDWSINTQIKQYSSNPRALDVWFLMVFNTLLCCVTRICNEKKTTFMWNLNASKKQFKFYETSDFYWLDYYSIFWL